MDLLILIVTFNGAATLHKNLTHLLGMQWLERVFFMVIDNASSDNSADIAHLCLKDNSCNISLKNGDNLSFSSGDAICVGNQTLLLQFPENRGVAAAYNRGILEASVRGIQWMMILDQDTEISGDVVSGLMAAAERLNHKGYRVAGVAPVSVNGFFPEHIYHPYVLGNRGLRMVNLFDYHESVVLIDSTITSGTLYNIKALQDINGFNDAYFIDFVDHECHIRLKKRGWQIWCDRNSEIVHYIGNLQKKIPNGIWVEHSPFRYFFMVRNMLEAHFRLFGLKGGLSFIKMMLGHMLLVLKYAEQPFKIMANSAKGVFAFLREKANAGKGKY
ncbi:hypothetical protein MTBBW1_2030032 [Desulfamplus magnetovallimortis]|uniref:Glycosyltransferase 2-like domain-containing protein n=1 Tax=Desulfamplus magnetovallimortis TaxID=1246637 RepID=A0A1W1HC11_9BACT|nr:glycosyltransferase [Desulfamplus magnetovallimortis]SLM29942.1 hypothetical protein MTBBW1_2030032 [Desulfamplus magnetovallimortis]